MSKIRSDSIDTDMSTHSTQHLFQRSGDVSDWPTPSSLHESGSHDDGCCYDNDGNSSNPLLSCVLYGVTLLSSMISQIISEHEDVEVQAKRRTPTNLGARLHGCSRLLTLDMANSLYEMLPETSRIDAPRVVFATYRDGWSMMNLLEKVRDKDPVIILVRTLRTRAVIGAYSTARLSPPSARVRGNGECFVFRLSSPSAAHRWTYIPSLNKASQNQFVVSTNEYIAFGGAANTGTNALRIDSDLRTCDSGPSDTYQSPPLVPEEEPGPFEVQDIEIIQVTDSRRRRKRN